MSNYVQLTREQLIRLIEQETQIKVLDEIKTQLMKYGYSPKGILLTKLERRKLTLQGVDVGPEPEWPGKNLPPIIGEMRG